MVTLVASLSLKMRRSGARAVIPPLMDFVKKEAACFALQLAIGDQRADFGFARFRPLRIFARSSLIQPDSVVPANSTNGSNGKVQVASKCSRPRGATSTATSMKAYRSRSSPQLRRSRRPNYGKARYCSTAPLGATLRSYGAPGRRKTPPAGLPRVTAQRPQRAISLLARRPTPV